MYILPVRQHTHETQTVIPIINNSSYMRTTGSWSSHPKYKLEEFIMGGCLGHKVLTTMLEQVNFGKHERPSIQHVSFEISQGCLNI